MELVLKIAYIEGPDFHIWYPLKDIFDYVLYIRK